MKPRYLLDTHALVFAAQNEGALGAKSRHLLKTAAGGEIVTPSHAIVELGRLIEEGRVTTPGRPADWFAPALARFPVIPASLEAAIAAPVLGLPHSDPYDRLIVAEALHRGLILITKDGNITDSGLVRIIW